jgi:hypothetical protein
VRALDRQAEERKKEKEEEEEEEAVSLMSELDSKGCSAFLTLAAKRQRLYGCTRELRAGLLGT